MSAVADKSVVDQIIDQVKQLTPTEQAVVMREVDKLVGRAIVKTPNVCGGDARIDGTRIPVWVLEGYRRLGLSDAELLDAYPTIGPGDLSQAWAYVSGHNTEITQAIRENNEG